MSKTRKSYIATISLFVLFIIYRCKIKAFHNATRYLCYGRKYPDYRFLRQVSRYDNHKVPSLRIEVPELRVLPYDAFIIGENAFPLYC